MFKFDINKTFITSDPHIGHTNLVSGTTKWTGASLEPNETQVNLCQKTHLGALRRFDTVEEHNATIISNINSVVKEDNWLIILGDLVFGEKEKNLRYLLDCLICKNIIVVAGNHDEAIVKRGLYTQFSEFYLDSLVFFDAETDTQVVCRHYPPTEDAQDDILYLWGHEHGTRKSLNSRDIGLDGNSLMPYSLRSLIDNFHRGII